MSESKIDNNLINLDNNSLIWDTHLTHEQFTTFNFCIQNDYHIPDPLYKLYKEFKLKQISCTNTILEIDDSVPMPNESIVTIPFLNETIIQQVRVPNETTGQSSFLPNKTTNDCNQMPIKAIVQLSLTPIMLCTNHSNNDSDNDILPYPKIYTIKSKENRKKAQKYFVLTSQEAMQSKVNDEEKKKKKVAVAEEKKLKKQKEKENKAQQKQEKEIQKLSKKLAQLE
ncbi:uncharacterized protein LOC136081588 [Hydra vulgaris]|uniref:Uncharacterized protein LOC136081588 n=1 Tax=Hydra vulgaris TaxID=6087 RepID=A0ABM4C0J4_HYDVU